MGGQEGERERGVKVKEQIVEAERRGEWQMERGKEREEEEEKKKG